MITITTRFEQFSRRNVKIAQRLSAQFLRALHYKGIKYIAAMGYKGTIHYHIACKGTKPSQKWIKDKWLRLSGCFEVDISEARENTPWYLIDQNAALLPNNKEGEFAWGDCSGNTFHRIRTSSGLFPRDNNYKPQEGRFEVWHRSDEEITALDVILNNT